MIKKHPPKVDLNALNEQVDNFFSNKIQHTVANSIDSFCFSKEMQKELQGVLLQPSPRKASVPMIAKKQQKLTRVVKKTIDHKQRAQSQLMNMSMLSSGTSHNLKLKK